MNTNPTNTGEPSSPGARVSSVGVAAPGMATRGEPFDFWRTAHRAVRGRGRLVLLLAAAGGLLGAWAGLMLGQRVYAATGMVRIASVLPQVLHETDQNRPIAMFDGFIEAQKEVMISRETVQAAMKEDSWQQVARGSRALTQEQFAAGLKVETRPRSDHLRVTFRNRDPVVTAAAVRSIIAAYQQAFIREQSRVEGQRVSQLQTRRVTLSDSLKAIQDRIAQIARGRSAAEIEPAYLAGADRVKRLRGALADVQFALAGGPDVALRQAGSARLPSEIADEEALRAYAAELAHVEIQLTQARSRGLEPAHREVQRLSAMAEQCREQVAKYTQACEARRSGGETGLPTLSLKEREANLRKLIQSAEDGMSQLAAERTQLKSLEEQAVVVRQNLAETEDRLDAISTEAATGGRLTVISGGDKPMTALLDNRAKTAGLGAVMGMAFPIGLLVLGTARRQRYRYCDEVAAGLLGRVPCIAVLPDADEGAALSQAAAHGVHELRVRLQPKNPADRRAYVITSVDASEGKTSLAAALGLSFAAAGFRTVVIDADLASRQLTLNFDAEESPGLVEAAANTEPAIRRVRGGLSVLTAGSCRPQDAFRLAPAAVGRLLTSLRERFDVVLIDSDPILTGLAASVIAPHADGVVLALARGQQQARVQSAVRHLQILGAVPAAAVFNRADAGDFHAVLSAQTPGPNRVLPERLNRFGSLVGATLASLSLTREDDMDLMPVGFALAKSDQSGRAEAQNESRRVA